MSVIFVPGNKVLRSAIHDELGGPRAGTISVAKKTNAILLFSKPNSNLSRGFETLQGFEPEGTFLFPGEGRSGDQSLDFGNLALAQSSIDSRKIYLFESEGAEAVFLGEFSLSPDEVFWVRTADFHGAERDALVFRLRPVDHESTLPILAEASRSLEEHDWTPPEWDDYVIRHRRENGAESSANRLEFQLECRFGLWRIGLGNEVLDLRIPVFGGHIEPDLYDKTASEIIEAKRSPSRDLVRMAVGQVLDYQHEVSSYLDTKLFAAVLFPNAPVPSLVDLCAELSIRVYVPDGKAFAELTGLKPSAEGQI